MSDSHVSMSVPVGDTPAPPPSSPGVTPPTVVRDDVWTVDSGSTLGGRQTPEQLRASLADTPPEPAPEADAPAPPTQAAAPAQDAPPADPPAEKPAEGKPKRDRIGRLQAEVHQLTRTKYETRAELEAAEARLKTLRAEIAGLEAKRPAPAPETPSPAAPPSPQQQAEAPRPVHPDDAAAIGAEPLWEAYEDQGKAWSEYAKDWREWLERKTSARVAREVADALEARDTKAKQDAQRQAEIDAEASAEAAYQAQLDEIEQADPTFPTRAKEVLAQYPYDPSRPDFRMDVVRLHPKGPSVLKHWVDHPEELASLTRQNDKLTHAMMITARAQDDPVPLLSYLATHPQETDAIARLPRERALLALGAITTRLAGAVQAAPAPVAPQITRAAAPIRPVGGTRTTGDATDLYDLPIEDFLKEKQRREAAARRRP